MENLSIADLYAAKSEAKEKEAYYRTLKAVNPDDFTTIWESWKERLSAFDKALVERINAIA